jgi:Holliday junction resolvase RusA-like endonuclease
MSRITTVRFTVDIEPRGKGRPRSAIRDDHIHIYTDAKTAAYEKEIAWRAKAAMGANPIFEGPLKMVVGVYVPIAKRAPKKFHEAMCAGLILPMKKPDLDNVVKACADACNGVVYKDDVQVVHLTAFRLFSRKPRIDVCVSVWDSTQDYIIVPAI